MGALTVCANNSAVFCRQESPKHLHELCDAAQTGHFIKTYCRMKFEHDEFWDQEIGTIASALAAIKPMVLVDIYNNSQIQDASIKEHSECSWVPKIHQRAVMAQSSYTYTLRLHDFPSRKRNSGA